MKPLLFLFLTGILCACTLSEQADMEINPKPTLVVEYRYTDTNGNNTTREEIGHTVSLLFDPAGMFLREITAFGKRFTDSITLLSGVPAGEYTVVTFANADGMERPVLTPGVSRMTELLCKRKDTGANRTAERLFHALARFTVQRGRPQVRRIELCKKYFRIKLSVTGADKLSGSADDFRVLFDGIPAGIDYRGEPLQETIRFTPLLEKDERHIRRILFRTAERGADNSPFEKRDDRRNFFVRLPGPVRRTDRLSLRQRGGDPHSHRRHILRNYRYGQRLGRREDTDSRNRKIVLIVSARAGGLPARALIRCSRLHRPE